MHNSFSFGGNKLGRGGGKRCSNIAGTRVMVRQLDARGWVITLYWFCQVISTSVSHTGGSGTLQSLEKGILGLGEEEGWATEGRKGEEEEDGGITSQLIPSYSPAPRWPCEHARCT